MEAANRICERPDSESPFDSAVKVAVEYDLLPGHIELVCRAFNTSNINQTRVNGTTLSEKLAACELLDANQVISAVFPDSSVFAKAAAESVVSDIYLAGKPETQKSASCGKCEDCEEASESEESEDSEDSDGDDKSGKSTKRVTVVSLGVSPTAGLPPMDMPVKVAHARQLSEEIQAMRRSLAASERTVGIKVAEAIDAYRYGFGNDPAGLPWLHEVMTHKHGEAGGAAVNLLADNVLTRKQVSLYEQERDYRQDLQTKTASEIETPQQFMSGIYKASPYPVREKREMVGKLEDVIDAVDDWFKLSSEFPKKAFEVRRQIDKLSGNYEKAKITLPGQSQEEADDYLFEKRAFNLSGVLGGMAGSGVAAIRGGGGSSGQSNASMPNKDVLLARLKLNDPSHDAELKRLEAEMAINDLITRDNVISNYTAEQVADAFEELDRSTPGITDSPMLLRANMRRELQGDLTPFEADAAIQSSDRADKAQRMRPLLSLTK